MLSRLALQALAPAGLRTLAPCLSVGVVHVSRPLHTCQQRLAPVPPLPEGGKVRHGIIPEEFFEFLYPKTGVTGPYMFGTGLLLYLLSKEIYVINHETMSGLCVLALIIFCVKKYGSTVAAFADKIQQDELNVMESVKSHNMNQLEEVIQHEKKEQWRMEGLHFLFDAKRTNVAVILETNYRERLLTVYSEVKKRLDYQLALQHLKRTMEKDHMISWIERNVKQSITLQQEKESIAKCILDLKMLSKSAQATV
ncbi:ATP synthase peripheral stalk subunit b, mitochondrial [Pogona vitticeps]|uniref:ATP synthase subunit b n=1 Tax=Pogona vitticeps TaxID=103695 RepID=A0A6J0SN53_9SAUR|nr:ATP synthase F(0) complex subunit B1, mitochondrial [Pogona vitticeps]